MIYFLLLTLRFFCSSFSSCFICRVSLPIWCFSCCLIYDCIAVNVPLRTSFAESHRFWVVMLSLLFVSRNLSNSFIISLVVQFSSVTQSCPTLQSHGLQHARPPCPSPTPRVYSNSCPLNQWCHPTISSSVIPLSSHLQSFPASVCFFVFFFSNQSVLHISWPKCWSFCFGISSSNGYSGVISLRMGGSSFNPRDSQESSPTPQFKSLSSSVLSFLYGPIITYMTTGKTIALTRQNF